MPCSKHLKAKVLILKRTPVTDQKRLEKLFMIVGSLSLVLQNWR
jgi:hypothetical protein